MPVDLEFQPSHTLSLVSNGVEIRIPTSFSTTVRNRTKENISITFDVTDPIIETGKCFVRQGGVDFVVLFLPFGRQGTMTVEGTGTVFRTDTGAYDTINSGSALLTYDTRQPELIFSDLPTRYEPGDSASADFIVGLNRNVTFDVTDPSNADQVFAFDGPYFGSAPGLYRYTGTGQPRLPLPADLLTATEWSLMRRNDYGQYFAVRFSQVPDTAQGTLNITLKDDVAVTPNNEDLLLAVTLPPPIPVPQMQSIPIIEKIATQFLELTADFDVTVNITGGPADTARVRGLAKGSHYDFDETNQTIQIRGNAFELLTDQMWRCTASGPGGDAAVVNQIYNYVELEPVVSALGKQTIYVGFVKNEIFIPISNGPSDGAVTMELVGMNYELVDRDEDDINDHMRIYGTVPDNNYSIGRGTFSVIGTNTGGDHTAETEFDLLNAKIYVAGFKEQSFNSEIKVFDTDNSNMQIGGDLALGTGDWMDIAMAGSLFATLNISNVNIIKVFDADNSNMQVGADISLGSGDWREIAMAGSLVAVIENNNDLIKVFDTNNNNAQLGADISLGSGSGRDIAMAGSLVAASDDSSNDLIKVFDTNNNNAQLGGDISLGSGNWQEIAMAGSLVAVIDNSSNSIKVFNTSNNNQQLGADISLGSGNWRHIAMAGSLVAASDRSSNSIKVFDTSNNNQQLGADISLGSGDWRDIAMAGSLVAAIDDSSNDHIKVFDTNNNNAQLGGDISLGSGHWTGVAMGIVVQ